MDVRWLCRSRLCRLTVMRRRESRVEMSSRVKVRLVNIEASLGEGSAVKLCLEYCNGRTKNIQFDESR